MPSQRNPAIFVEANIHAREWITSATATWLLNELLTSTDPEVRELATNIDLYFLVVANPDGFAFTHTNVKLLLYRISLVLYNHLYLFLEPIVA